MSATQTERPEGNSPDVSQPLLSILERLIEAQVEHTNVIKKQEQHLAALREQREIQLILDPNYIQFQDSRRMKSEIEEQWHNEILRWDPLRDWPLNDDRNFRDMLLPVSAEQLWTTWQYRAAYPNAAKFLARATPVEKSRSIVSCSSFFQSGEIVERWNSEDPYIKRPGMRVSMPERMWDIVKRRTLMNRRERSGRTGERLPSRLICVVDISPAIAAILLESTPKSVVSNVSPFLERYLTFTNFGKVSMQSIKSETVNSFIFEYHFAFYYVTKECLETHLVCTDVRKLRKFSWFGQRADDDKCGRHIYEEQMSFILIGHGQDTYTSYQLAEKFFNGPKSGELRTFVSSPTWTPSTMFLSWIAMALHHVGIRWQDAISAVDDQIASAEAVVFHEMNNFDLASGAKDLKISRLRTYFWALEAYKLFEETLEATVNAWEQFKRQSLDKANDGRNPEDYSKSVELIELAIARLQDKIEKIRKKSEQVIRLRDGLFYVTSLSDTSVTINQGENIRLLTYFTILFLPLSFSTSIFGMQSILPSTTSMKTFIIVLPVVTVSTILAVFILTGAIQDIQQAVHKNIPNPGQRLREFMLEHSRKKLGEVQLRNTRASGEQHGIWEFLTFFVELCFINIPVQEVNEAVYLYGLHKQRPTTSNNLGSTMSQRHLHSTTTLISEQGATPGELRNANTLARQVIIAQHQLAEERSARKGVVIFRLRQIPTVLFTAVRILLLCIWVPLLLIEYLVLLFYSPFTDKFATHMQRNSQRRTNKREQIKRFFIGPFLFLGFDFSCLHAWRNPAEHEHRSPLPTARPYGHALAPLPLRDLQLDQTAISRTPTPAGEQHGRSAQRIRQVMAKPNFQAAYQQQYHSGPSATTAVPAQHNTPLRSHKHSNSKSGVPRRVGDSSMDLEQESGGR